jgi:hypothetical protein
MVPPFKAMAIPRLGIPAWPVDYGVKSVSAANRKQRDGQVIRGARIIWIDPKITDSSPPGGDLFLQLYKR